MTAKAEKKPASADKPQDARSVPAETEIAEATLDTVVGGLARRSNRLS